MVKQYIFNNKEEAIIKIEEAIEGKEGLDVIHLGAQIIKEAVFDENGLSEAAVDADNWLVDVIICSDEELETLQEYQITDIANMIHKIM